MLPKASDEAIDRSVNDISSLRKQRFANIT